MDLLSSVKDHLRMDGTDADDIILELMDSAKSYIEASTGRAFSEKPLEVLCLKLLVELWFDGRPRTVVHGIDSMLTQIKYTK